MSDYDPGTPDAYTQHLAEVNEKKEVLASEDIVNANGVLVVAKGTPIKRDIADKILNHKLLKPLEDTVKIEDAITGDSLFNSIKIFVNSNIDLKKIHEKHELNKPLKALCKQYNEYSILTQKLTVLSLRLPEEFEKGLFCSWLSVVLAKQLKLNIEQTESTFLAGLAHDIGMLHIAPEILDKTDEYTAEEWRAMQSHVVIGQRILSNMSGMPQDVSVAVLEHHERCDGTGYPSGKFAKNLTTLGQIVALADALYPIRFKKFVDDGRSLLETVPIMQLNDTVHFYDTYCALALVVRSSDLTPINIVKETEIPSFIDKQLTDASTLILSCKVVVDIDKCLPNDNKHQLVVACNLTDRICASLRRTGLLSAELRRWMEYVRDNKLTACYREMEEISLMQQELSWQISRARRQLQVVLEDKSLHKFLKKKTSLQKFYRQLCQLNEGAIPDGMNSEDIDMIEILSH